MLSPGDLYQHKKRHYCDETWCSVNRSSRLVVCVLFDFFSPLRALLAINYVPSRDLSTTFYFVNYSHTKISIIEGNKSHFWNVGLTER